MVGGAGIAGEEVGHDEVTLVTTGERIRGKGDQRQVDQWHQFRRWGAGTGVLVSRIKEAMARQEESPWGGWWVVIFRRSGVYRAPCGAAGP